MDDKRCDDERLIDGQKTDQFQSNRLPGDKKFPDADESRAIRYGKLLEQLSAADGRSQGPTSGASRRGFMQMLMVGVAVGTSTPLSAVGQNANCPQDVYCTQDNICQPSNTCAPNTCVSLNTCDVNECVIGNICSESNNCVTNNNEDCATGNNCGENECFNSNTCNFNTCDTNTCSTNTCEGINNCGMEDSCSTDDSCMFNECETSDTDCGYWDSSCLPVANHS